MNSPVLSRDAEKMICVLYKVYLERRKAKTPKAAAREFSDLDQTKLDGIADWLDADRTETAHELKQAGFVKRYIDGSVVSEDAAIVFMENRFKNGLTEVISFLANFIP